MKFRLLSSKREVQIVPNSFGLVKKRVAKWPIWVILLSYVYLGAGKHPSPLDISESYSPHLYLKVGFYLIKKYCSCPKLSQFKDRALL